MSTNGKRSAPKLAKPFEIRSYLKRNKGMGAVIANACGIRRQAIPQWTIVPAPRVIKVAEIIGIPPHILRPDLYPRALSRR